MKLLMTQKRFKNQNKLLKIATCLIIGGSSAVGFAIVSNSLSYGHKVFASYFRTPIEFKHPQLTSFKWDVLSEWPPRNYSG